ncbi:MAG: hypothetical protein RQ741_08805 [Wenzhouxiangellaceae bacterium]|nr:hypothetical protein [Wenzhouxiangellaceae bacterium]
MRTISRLIPAMFLVLLAAGTALAEECPQAEWALGEWRGEIMGTGTIVVFRFQSNGENCLKGNFDMPQHDADHLPFSRVLLIEDQQVLEVHSDALDFVYEGQYQGGELEGTFTQNEAAYVLKLERVTKPAN